jgi:hypothetical protein
MLPLLNVQLKPKVGLPGLSLVHAPEVSARDPMQAVS